MKKHNITFDHICWPDVKPTTNTAYGKKIGRLRLIQPLYRETRIMDGDRNNHATSWFWLAECECGNETIVRSNTDQRSCGCTSGQKKFPAVSAELEKFNRAKTCVHGEFSCVHYCECQDWRIDKNELSPRYVAKMDGTCYEAGADEIRIHQPVKKEIMVAENRKIGRCEVCKRKDMSIAANNGKMCCSSCGAARSYINQRPEAAIAILQELKPNFLPKVETVIAGANTSELTAEVERLKGLVTELGEKNTNLVKAAKDMASEVATINEANTELAGALSVAEEEKQTALHNLHSEQQRAITLQDEVWKLREEVKMLQSEPVPPQGGITKDTIIAAVNDSVAAGHIDFATACALSWHLGAACEAR